MQEKTKQTLSSATIIGLTAGLMVFVLQELAGSIRNVYQLVWQQRIEQEDLEKEQVLFAKLQEQYELESEKTARILFLLKDEVLDLEERLEEDIAELRQEIEELREEVESGGP